MKGFLIVPLLGLFLSCGSAYGQTAPSGASSSSASTSVTEQTSVLGKVFGVSYTTSANTAQNGMTLSLNAVLLGNQTSLVTAAVEPSANFADGELQLYVAGTQVSNVTGAMESANWADQVTFPALNTNATIVSIPIGPFTIEVDGGYSLTGNLKTDVALELNEGQVTPTTPPSGIEATLGTTIAAGGFLKGSVSLIFIRGGLEGQLEAADGSVQTEANLYFGKTPPTFSATGSLGFFAGSVSAFADYWALFGWQNFWNATLFSWNGFCLNFANGVKVSGKCAAQ